MFPPSYVSEVRFDYWTCCCWCSTQFTCWLCSMLLGNYLAKNKVVAEPIVTHDPDVVFGFEWWYWLVSFMCCYQSHGKENLKVMMTVLKRNPRIYQSTFHIFFFGNTDKINQEKIAKKSQLVPLPDVDHHFIGRKQLVEEQKNPELLRLRVRVQPSEADKVSECLNEKMETIRCKTRWGVASGTSNWGATSLPTRMIKLAQDTPMAEHLGVKKTSFKILQHFYWPWLSKDVSEFIKSCHECQIIVKSNQKIPPAPLLPIPDFEEPFSRIFINCVGPLPKTKAGNSYMCASTRFSEAIPLRNIKATTIIKH